MAAILKNLSNDTDVPKVPEAAYAIACSEYHADITASLQTGAIDTLRKHDVAPNSIQTFSVPGAFELPVAAQFIAETEQFDAVICLGCVIKGDTEHDRYINQSIAQGLIQVGLDYHLPVIFGVLTTQNRAQALARAGGEQGNKGVEAALAALKMVALQGQTARL